MEVLLALITTQKKKKTKWIQNKWKLNKKIQKVNWKYGEKEIILRADFYNFVGYIQSKFKIFSKNILDRLGLNIIII